MAAWSYARKTICTSDRRFAARPTCISHAYVLVPPWAVIHTKSPLGASKLDVQRISCLNPAQA